MDAASIIAIGTAASAVLASLGTLIVGLRNGAQLGQVQSSVDGTSTQLHARINELQTQLVETARQVPAP